MNPIRAAIEVLTRLPGIGEKSAARLVFYLLSQPSHYLSELTQALMDLKEKVRFCSACQNVTGQDPCEICANPKREYGILCIVERPQDVAAMERTGSFSGFYHVLHGAISPLDEIGPEELKIAELMRRLENGSISEIVLAMDATVEGDTTALYLTRLLKSKGIKVTRLAAGVPMGAEVEYLDASTLSRAFQDRREVD